MLEQVFHAIADQHRREILQLIQNSELSVGEISSHFDLTQPAISQHLRVLVEAQLVTVRRQGTRHLYQARPEGLAEVKEFLESFWDTSLQKLKQAAELEERKTKAYGNIRN